jgi:hypothetical protein
MSENKRKLKLSDEYPVINTIKNRMKKDENFSKDQVRDFERKTARTYSNMFLIKMLQEFHNAKIRLGKKCLEKDTEIKRLESCCHSHAEKYKEAEKRIIEVFGEKSYEYEIFKGR